MAAVAIEQITKKFAATPVLNGVSLDVADGEFLTLVGASGCGKSTLLRIIAGLEAQDGGTIAIGGQPVDHLRPKQRNIAMVFQSYALYPHMTVGENIAMPLVMRRLRLAERLPLLGALSPRRAGVMRAIHEAVGAVARQIQIDHLLARKPAQLSGGQRQRVALGRAMVRQPDVFLMDEPLSNLDAKLRVHMRAELAELHRRLGVTFIYVTHDQTEAMTMSDRVAMMDEGRIVQLGTPSELYGNPTDLRVARFIGSPAINVLPAQVRGGVVEVLGIRLALALAGPDRPVQLGVRPEAVSLHHRVGEGRFAARLRHVENLGAEYLIHLDPAAIGSERVVARMPAEAFHALAQDGALGETLGISLRAERALLFDAEGRRLHATAASTATAMPAAAA